MPHSHGKHHLLPRHDSDRRFRLHTLRALSRCQAEKTALDYAYESKAKPGDFAGYDEVIKMLEDNGAKLGKDVYCPIIDATESVEPEKPAAIAA